MKKTIKLSLILLLMSLPTANAESYTKLDIDKETQIEIMRFIPALSTDSEFSQKNVDNQYGVYLLQHYYLQNKDFDKYINLHLDKDQAENLVVNFKGARGQEWIDKIINKSLSGKAVAILKSGEYSLLITENENSRIKYSMTAFYKQENQPYLIIAIPYYYQDKMPKLMEAYNLLNKDELTLE